MNPIEFLNQNPAILLASFSIIAFPFGLLVLAFVLQKSGIGVVVGKFLTALREHTQAEIGIKGELEKIVIEIKNQIAANWDNRRYLDDKFDHFDERIDILEKTLQEIIIIIPKRKEDLA